MQYQSDTAGKVKVCRHNTDRRPHGTRVMMKRQRYLDAADGLLGLATLRYTQSNSVAHVVRGQYEGYRQEKGVSPDSQTETMIALKAEVDNWRWHGVPFFLRSGKSLGAGRQVITLGFHEPPLRMFKAHRKDIPDGRRNEIIIDFADPGSITAKFLAKEPGAEMTLGGEKMLFAYADSFAQANALEGYERLILDAMIGDQSLFTSSDGIQRLWEISQPLLENPPPVQPYAKGSWGPESVDTLIEPFRWHLPNSG